MDLQNSRKVAYLIRQGVLSAQNGDLEPAAAYFEEALSLSPDFYAPYYNLGCVYFRMGRRAEACHQFQEALERANDDSRILNNLAVTLQELEDLPEAEDLYRKVLSRDPLHDLAHYNLGRLLFLRGEFRSAIAHWAFVPADSPVWPKAILNLAIAFGRLKKWPKSLQYLQRVAHIWDGDVDFHIARAEAYEGLGQWRSAMDDWSAVAGLARDDHSRSFARARVKYLSLLFHPN
ncbi:MAG: tetratricopeptide repeat protein [bacterium JZ-2024 1]